MLLLLVVLFEAAACAATCRARLLLLTPLLLKLGACDEAAIRVDAFLEQWRLQAGMEDAALLLLLVTGRCCGCASVGAARAVGLCCGAACYACVQHVRKPVGEDAVAPSTLS